MSFNYNKKYIKSILKDIPFDNEDFTKVMNEHNSDEVFDILKRNRGFRFGTGATKLVVIPRRSKYVIKIPCRASLEYNGCWDEDDYYYESGDYNELAWAEYPISGGSGWDYCKTEAELYELAKERGLDKFFAETKFVGYVRGWPIYLQQKCMIYGEECYNNYPGKNYKRHTNEQIKTAKEKSHVLKQNVFNMFPDVWAVDLVNNYSKDEIDNLLDFIQEYNINDLHSNNIGYIYNINNRFNHPVITDYSSYNESS